MRAIITAVAGLAMSLTATPAFAWGEPGHELVGAVAQRTLEQANPAVAKQVASLLGSLTLAQATTWADCARDVHKTAQGTFTYETSKYTPQVCQTDALKAEIPAMTDYARRNWNQCVYTAQEGCLGTYHFADVAYGHAAYDRAWVGTGPHDIVSVIDQAYALLHTGAATGVATIASKREALLLIAHLVGDLHQPLHVGAVYLDANGRITDPDAAHLPLTYCEGAKRVPCTTGGNSITVAKGKNLHATWDDIPETWSVDKDPDLVSGAMALPATPGAPEGWAAAWASESVVEAGRVAFAGLGYRFTGTDKDPAWSVQFADTQAYAKAREAEQRQQITRAGARLAQILIAALSN